MALVVVAAAAPSWAAGAKGSTSGVAPPTRATITTVAGHGDEDVVQRLGELASIIAGLEKEITALEAKMHKTPVAALRARQGKRLDDLHRRLDRTRASFQDLAAHVSLERLRHAPRIEERDLLAEVRELTAPVLDAFRRMSARPRRIEGLRAELANLDQRIRQAEHAHVLVDALLRANRDTVLGAELELTDKALMRVRDELKQEQADKKRQLDHAIGKDPSMVSDATRMVSEFLATKGRNLLLAFLVWMVTLLALMSLRQRLFPVDRLQSGRFAWLAKPLGALYGLLAFCAATVTGLMTFYVMGDMLLFTVALLALSLAIWSTRQFVPRFIREARLVLNLGPVREGERVIWRGLPWKVKKLGIRPLLVNPALQGGAVRVRAAMLLDDVSRAVVDAERWFPTEVGDWVVLKDGTWGRIQVQTPEHVIVTVAGVTDRTYAIEHFVDQRPDNLSHGFRLCVDLPVSVAASAHLESLIDQLSARLHERFAAELAPADGGETKAPMARIAVLAMPPAASHLIVQAQLDCDGALANRWRPLQSDVVRTFIGLCNENSWPLPAVGDWTHAPFPEDKP